MKVHWVVLTVRIQTSLSPSLVAHMVKNLPAMWETQVQSLDQEDPLENGMATHSRVLAWKIPWTEEPGRLQSMRSQSWTRLSDFTSLHISIRYTTLGMDLFVKINWPMNISEHLYTPWQKHSAYTKRIIKEVEL